MRQALLTIVLVLLATAGPAAETTGTAPKTETDIKAAFLRNFAKFVRWPKEAFENPNAPLVIGVLGTDPLGQALDDAVRQRTAHGRPLEVLRLNVADGKLPSRETLTRCHLLFVSRSEQQRVSAILERLDGSPVLTVSDIEGFATAGGMAEFVLVGINIKFRFNRHAARQSDLRPSASLLRVAILVDP